MKTVLIVEDDWWLADSFCRNLERAGYRVLVEYNAQNAIEAIDENKVDLILLDIFLPEGNGIQFLQELRSYSDTMTTPVIVCSTASKQLPDGALEQFGVFTILDKTTLTSSDLRRAISAVVTA